MPLKLILMQALILWDIRPFRQNANDYEIRDNGANERHGAEYGNNNKIWISHAICTIFLDYIAACSILSHCLPSFSHFFPPFSPSSSCLHSCSSRIVWHTRVSNSNTNSIEFLFVYDNKLRTFGGKMLFLHIFYLKTKEYRLYSCMEKHVSDIMICGSHLRIIATGRMSVRVVMISTQAVIEWKC